MAIAIRKDFGNIELKIPHFAKITLQQDFITAGASLIVLLLIDAFLIFHLHNVRRTCRKLNGCVQVKPQPRYSQVEFRYGFPLPIYLVECAISLSLLYVIYIVFPAIHHCFHNFLCLFIPSHTIFELPYHRLIYQAKPNA